jgi:hypothetical protein
MTNIVELHLVCSGTTVLAIQAPDAVYVGVDSKVVEVGSAVSDSAAEPKIHRIADVIFAHAGMFRDTHGKLHVLAGAVTAIAAGGELDEVAARFAASVEPQVLSTLGDVRESNPEYFQAKLKRPVETLFATVREGKSQTIALWFEVVDANASYPAVNTKLVRCPGDCPDTFAAFIVLGEHDAADRFLETHRDVLASQGPAALIDRLRLG